MKKKSVTIVTRYKKPAAETIRHLRAQLRDCREAIRIESGRSFARGYNEGRRELTNILRAALGIDSI
jgi:hypothetical protein